MNYYNDNDPTACAWLRQLMYDRLIPEGIVDDRPIQEIKAEDLRGFTQHHFFTGIGGWAEALRLAGWPADRPVWTASCPCQPFSTAGKGEGEKDERPGPGGFWDDFTLLPCRDGHVRRAPSQSALFPLAHGIQGRVGLLRGSGNAIVPQAAAKFVQAILEVQGGVR